jgi:CheY-like chemotaxis protein
LARAFEGVSRIRRVVDGLRSYARPAGAQFVPADVHHIVQAAMRVASPQLRRVASIELDLQPVPCVLGDEGQLVQMIVNPLVNAAQALRDVSGRAALEDPAGRIRVATRLTVDGSVEITIADNGPGFPADVLPRLGEPYVTTKRTEGGTGLGVFVTQGLVQAHKGTLVMQNATGGGAVVRIALPACACDEHVVAARPTLAASEGAVARRHVLLVDDEPLVLGAIARGLVRAGYHVTLAADGAEALQLLRTQPFDAVVSDLMMPRLTGMELAQILETERPQARPRFVAMTGGAVSSAAEAFVADQRAPVLYKPIDLGQLIATIEGVVA